MIKSDVVNGFNYAATDMKFFTAFTWRRLTNAMALIGVFRKKTHTSI
jgi:hypothetical protein